jgi:hypothetical protein
MGLVPKPTVCAKSPDEKRTHQLIKKGRRVFGGLSLYQGSYGCISGTIGRL